MMRSALSICVLCTLTSAVHAQDGGVRTSVDAGSKTSKADAAVPKKKVAKGPPPAAKMVCTPNPVHIGEPLICTLTVIHRADVSITVTSPSEVKALKADPAQPHGDGKLKSVRQLQILPDSMKKVHVKDLAVRWTEADDSVGELSIPAQRIVVKSMMVGVKDPRPRTYETPEGHQANAEEASEQAREKKAQFWDAHGPTAYRVTNWALIISLLVLIGGGLGVLIGIWVNRWLRARRADQVPWVDPRPAHVIAYEALEKLASDRLPERGLNEEYYVKISEIVRGYLKRRYGINGLEMTSEEIKTWTQNAHLDEQAQLAVADFLYETDIVKFANVKPSAHEIELITQQARALIEWTKSLEEKTDETESGSTGSDIPSNHHADSDVHDAVGSTVQGGNDTPNGASS